MKSVIITLLACSSLCAQSPLLGGGPSGSTGPTGAVGSVTVLLQGTIQGTNGVAFAANLPSSIAPSLCPGSGCVTASPSTVAMPTLEWPTSQSTYYAWWTWTLGSAYVANSAISYIVEYYSADSTHAAIVTPAWACIATSGSPSNPSFTSVSTVSLTAGASSFRTVSATQTITPTCSPGNRVWLKFTIDTNTNSMTSAFELMSVKVFSTGLL